MITFVTGKPGDGKSLYSVALLLRDLVEGQAFVVTNIPLVPSAVCVYVANERQRLRDETPFNFDDLCRVLSDAEVYEFYRRRSGGLVLAESPDAKAAEDGTKRLDRPDFTARMKAEFLRIAEAPADCQRPCHFYIDEAHNFFSAREWAQTGRGLLYYTSQHRHLHDNIWFITQVLENVEKQLRGLASETHRIRNQLRRSVGPFRMRPCFKIHRFYGVPSENAQNLKPYSVETMFLDPAGVAACYRTVGALGVQSKPEAIKNRAPLPWWTMWVAGALVVSGLGFAFLALPALGSKYAGTLAGSALDAATEKAGVVIPQGEPPALAPAPSPRASFLDRRRESTATAYATGWVSRGGSINVTLSDGRTLTESRTPGNEHPDDLTHVARNYVETRSGARYYLRPSPSTSERPAAKATPSGAPSSAPGPSLARDEGSWVRGPDGVTRLKERESLPSAFRGSGR